MIASWVLVVAALAERRAWLLNFPGQQSWCKSRHIQDSSCISDLRYVDVIAHKCVNILRSNSIDFHLDLKELFEIQNSKQ